MLAFCLLLPVACHEGSALVAGDAPPFRPDLPAKARCRVRIDDLRPTQFAVGYWEVDRRAERVSLKRTDRLAAYLEEHLPQIVIGPGGVAYLIDGHHLALVLLKSRLATSVEAEIAANWRSMRQADFWKAMVDHGWLYLYDEHGRGPQDPEKLPRRVTDLKDDPYRALAWAVRKRGGFTKTDDPFLEFRWANYLRQRVPIGRGAVGFERAVEEALALCGSPEAQRLPGYRPCVPAAAR